MSNPLLAAAADILLEPVTVSALPASMLSSFKQRLLPMIDRVVERSHGEQSSEALWQMVVDGNAVILTASRDTEIIGVVVASRQVYQSGMAALYCDAVAGDDLEEWMPKMVETLAVLAKTYHCQRVTGTGRKGWCKYLEKFGFETIHQTMALEV